MKSLGISPGDAFEIEGGDCSWDMGAGWRGKVDTNSEGTGTEGTAIVDTFNEDSTERSFGRNNFSGDDP